MVNPWFCGLFGLTLSLSMKDLGRVFQVRVPPLVCPVGGGGGLPHYDGVLGDVGGADVVVPPGWYGWGVRWLGSVGEGRCGYGESTYGDHTRPA